MTIPAITAATPVASRPRARGVWLTVSPKAAMAMATATPGSKVSMTGREAASGPAWKALWAVRKPPQPPPP